MGNGRCTADKCAGRVGGALAGPGIVGVEKGAYNCSTLVVATGTLTTGTAEALVFLAA